MDWEAALALTDRVCAGTFDSTPCRLQPMATGATVNHKSMHDPDRVSFDFLGTIDLEPPSDRIARHIPADMGARSSAVSYAAVLTALVKDWPFLPRHDDIVLAGGIKWKIAAKEDDGSGRPAWYLNKA